MWEGGHRQGTYNTPRMPGPSQSRQKRPATMAIRGEAEVLIDAENCVRVGKHWDNYTVRELNEGSMKDWCLISTTG